MKIKNKAFGGKTTCNHAIFRRLDVYQSSKKLSKYIYGLSTNYPAEERFALCSQLRRTLMSISINIAEGIDRFSSKEKPHFLEMPFGPLKKVLSKLKSSLDAGYISKDEFQEAKNQLSVISKQLFGLHLSIIRSGNSSDKA